MTVTRLFDLPADFDRLVQESKQEGYKFLEKLKTQWDAGTNRFGKPGEILFSIHEDDQLAAIGGLNVDPYLEDPKVGRIRHVYVSQLYRKRGWGRLLVEKLIDHADLQFEILRLSTTNPVAQNLYLSLGFEIDSEVVIEGKIQMKKVLNK